MLYTAQNCGGAVKKPIAIRGDQNEKNICFCIDADQYDFDLVWLFSGANIDG